MPASPRQIVTALVTTVFGYSLMQTVVVPALGLLTRELHTTPAWSAWILSAFLLSSAVLTPLLGRLGDLYGKRRVMVGVLAAYAVGMAGAALAQDIAQLIAARVVQGSALAVVPLSMAILREALPRERLASAMGLVSGIVGAGAGAGLVVGGLLADQLSWRYLFVLGALLALISLGMVARWVPRGERAASGQARRARLCAARPQPRRGAARPHPGPFVGVVAPVLGLFTLGVVLAVGLLALERRRSDALIDVAELADRPMLATHRAALGVRRGIVLLLPGAPALRPARTRHGRHRLRRHGHGLRPADAARHTDPAADGHGGRQAVRGVRLRAGRWRSWVLGDRRWVRCCSPWPTARTGITWCSTGWSARGPAWCMGALPKLIADMVPLARTGTANGLNNIARTVGGVVGSDLAAAVIASGSGGSAGAVHRRGLHRPVLAGGRGGGGRGRGHPTPCAPCGRRGSA